MAKKSSAWRKGTPLDDTVQERLRALIKQKGDEEVSELLGIGRASVMKAAAGGRLRRVTAIAIEARLTAKMTD
jgi:hypothetical protein